ncbi:receptor-like protein EIX2 [Rosa rugosa]|uniref:receptor-like protein EIX2 n=1 Tax=Rosa rugosa TaxID=74645 RepID=UPI002B410695|nr:receptor-like protein EIX2 [Rosa rugosa]
MGWAILSVLDGVQLADTFGTAGVRSPQVSVLWGIDLTKLHAWGINCYESSSQLYSTKLRTPASIKYSCIVGCITLSFFFCVLLFDLLNMDKMCLKLFYPLVVLLLHMSHLGFVSGLRRGATNIRCIEKERQALLAVKQGLVGNHSLSSWGSNATTDCCKWEGVHCSKQTGHVTKLDLHSTWQYLPLQSKISPELFELQHLEYLNLSYNSFSDNQIPKSIGSLSNLKFLDLSDSSFGGEVPYQLGNLTQLQFLDLGGLNYFTNPKNLNWLPHLSSLTHLNLEEMNLSNVLHWPKVVDKLPKLQSLTLSSCDLPIPILSSLSHINTSKSLSSVDLSDNHLTFSIFHWLSTYNTSLVSVDLSANNLSGSIPDVLGNLSSLLHLSLAANSIEGQVPKAIGQLCSLQSLDLSYNKLSGSIPDVFSNLSSLLHLSLAANSIEGQVPKTVGQLCSLQSLDLSHNNLSGSIPDVFGNLSSLLDLYLGFNSIEGQLPKTIGRLSSLQLLDLSHNNLSGSIPDVFGNLSSLLDLYLGFNSIEGQLPKTIGRLCSLQLLDLSRNNHSGEFSEFIQGLFGCGGNSIRILLLSGNQLTGRIPERIGSLSNLENFNVSMNSLTGVITEAHFSNLSKLLYLDLSSNSLTLNIRSDWLPPFQLVRIRLMSCKIGPHFPKWLRTSLRSFYELDLSDAGIYDIIPSWFQDNSMKFSQYRVLSLSSNQLEGPIHSLPSGLSSLDLSSNKLSGRISFLCASKNRNLTFLDLSNNSFSGELPNCWKHLENLVILDLSNNAFSGKIPTSIGSLASLETLKLSKNNFAGELPSSLKNCTNLQFFDIGENRITGKIPEWMGISFSKLAILILRSNQFSGSLPLELCHLKDIQLLDLSRNCFSGTIPQCLNNLTTLAQKGSSSPSIMHSVFATIYYVHYEDDASLIWKGRMSKYKSTLGLVKSIDFSSNRLDGEIPRQITDLIGLVSLNLSRNYLTGQMPPQIGKLQSLDFLDLSRNHIYGRIPTSLSQMYGLGVLDLSNNNLSGKIPIGTQLQSFDPSTYAENPQLCGLPLQKICPTGETRSKQVPKEEEDELISFGFYVSMGLGFVVGFWGVCGSLIFNRSWRYTYFGFLNVLRDWVYVRAMLIRRQRML